MKGSRLFGYEVASFFHLYKNFAASNTRGITVLKMNFKTKQPEK
jgi:hypothetical protein